MVIINYNLYKVFGQVVTNLIKILSNLSLKLLVKKVSLKRKKRMQNACIPYLHTREENLPHVMQNNVGIYKLIN